MANEPIEVGGVKYTVDLDDSDLDSQIPKTEKKVGGLKGAFSAVGKVGGAAIKGLGAAYAGLTSAAAASVAAVAKMGVEYNAQMEVYQTSFATMLGDAEKAQALTDNLKTLAAKTPLAMTDLAEASQTLLAFGTSAEALPDQLKRLGDVAQGNAQKLGTMATAFGRIQSNGRASLEEINMMIDQGFNPLNIIAEQTGETMEQVRDRVSKGQVSFEEMSEALRIATDEGGQFYNAMENQSKTFEGQMSTLKDNLSALAGTLTNDLFASLSQSALPQVNEWVDELLTAAEKGGVEGAIDAAGSILTEAITALLDAAPDMLDTALSLVGSFLDGVQDSLPDVLDGAEELLWTLVDGLLDKAPQLLSTGFQLIASLISGLGRSLPQIISKAGELVNAIIDSFFQINWLQVGRDVIWGIIQGLGSLGGALWDAAARIGENVLNAIKGVFDSHSPSKKARALAATVPQGIVAEFDEDTTVEKASHRLGNKVLDPLFQDVAYNLPDSSGLAKDLAYSFSGSVSGGAQIEVPLYLDGREIARASAWYMGEQLSWEER